MNGKTTLMIIGVIVLVLGILAYVYTSTTTDSYLGGLVKNQKNDTPYRDYTFPLVLAGVVLIIVGLAIPQQLKH